MALTPDDIGRIANLARLELRPDEGDRLLAQLNGFFDVVEKMRAVDTTGLEPMAHPVAAIQDVALRLREDVVGSFPSREDSQKSAPAVEAGLYLVPRVIE
ncbi:MAG: Asp-tRNA(Asn)/Glu-tRNA(Gln) amidotransferase subunit GatC [Pseudomonadota bacterium]